jgi:hypothetical protein
MRAHLNLEFARARMHAIEGALLALAREHGQGEIGDLEHERRWTAYKRENAEPRRRSKRAQDKRVGEIAQE